MTAAAVVDRASVTARTPVPTPALYEVRIGHTRTEPWRRAFVHRATLWLVDLDDVASGRLAQDGPLRPWLRAQVRFEAADHLGDPSRSIKDNVVAFARLHGVPDVARVLMLAHPRSGLGSRASYVFNPLSTHWCYRTDATLACIVAEVHNTYGERHAYLLPPDEAGRSEVDKEFYVSPFLPVAGRYRMRFSAPGPSVSVAIALQQGDRTPFSAWLQGTARAATVRAVTRAVLRRPAMALQGAGLIRVHGVALWLRRLPMVPRPPHHVPPGVGATDHERNGART